MKKTRFALFMSLLIMVFMSSSAFAVYTGEEGEEPKEGEFHILTTVEEEEEALEKESVPVRNENPKPNERGEMTTTTVENPALNDTVEEKENTVFYIAGGIVLLLGLVVLLFKRKK